MIVKYKTSYSADKIERVEVLRETAQSVFLPTNRDGERRDAKISTYTQYHDTWDAAHAYLLEKAEKEVAYQRARLEGVKGRLGNIKGMKPPKDAK